MTTRRDLDLELGRDPRPRMRPQAAATMALLLSLVAAGWMPAPATGPNTVAQWDKIAEDTVVASGALQIEGFRVHGLRRDRGARPFRS